MKFKEYLIEAKEKNLIGLNIDGKRVTRETPNEIWKGDFICSYQNLTSLEGAPKEVTGRFYCHDNKLTSLKGAPKKVGDYCICTNSKLTSLEGAPIEVYEQFICANGKLTSLEYAPKIIRGNFHCNNNKITSLKNIHKIISRLDGLFYCTDNPIKSHVLGLLLIPGILDINADGGWDHILNKYLGKGRKGLLDCQNELIEAGFEELAQI